MGFNWAFKGLNNCVDLSWTLNLVQSKALSTLTHHSTDNDIILVVSLLGRTPRAKGSHLPARPLSMHELYSHLLSW